MNKQIKFKKNLIFKRILFLIMLCLTFYIIFDFSSQDITTSISSSKKVTNWVFSSIFGIEIKADYIKMLDFIIRKIAHFAIYGVVGFSAMGFMCTFNMNTIFKFITSFSVGAIYAITDEIHQYFTPGRSASVIDVFIDSIGVLVGILMVVILILFFESIVNWVKDRYERKKVKYN